MKKKIKYKINIIFTLISLLLFVITPIMAEEDALIILVNRAGINGSSGYSIVIKNSKPISANDNYWAYELPITDTLIKDKSEKMADEFLQSPQYIYNNSLILFGFSQGGLRVRSMAQYISKNKLDKDHKIKGFITLNSPNFGSRLAEKSVVKNLGNYIVHSISSSASAVIPSSNQLLDIFLGISINTLSFEEQNEFVQVDKNLYEFTKSSLSKYLDIEKMKSYIDNLKDLNNEKGAYLLTQEGLKFLCGKIFGMDVDFDPQNGYREWFYDILNGALEYSLNTDPNVIEITKEFRQNSKFLNELNDYNNVNNYEYPYKRVSIIGSNGDINNVQTAYNILTTIKGVHWTLLGLYTCLGIGYCLNPFTIFKGLYYLWKATLNIYAYSNWSNLNKYYNLCLTGDKNNFNHDLLITAENQKLPYMRPESYKQDMEIKIPELNHIVPNSGTAILKGDNNYRENVKKKIEKRIYEAILFIEK